MSAQQETRAKTGQEPAASATSPGGGQPQQPAYHYLSDLLRFRVRMAGEARPFGRLEDVGLQSMPPLPQVVRLRVRSRDRSRRGDYAWSAVQEISPGLLTLRAGGARPGPEPHFWLRRDVLDDQVIDVSGAKVIRVNDVHLLHAEGRMLVVHVDVGILGILRRLGFVRLVTGLLRWLFDYTLSDALISWRFVELVGSGGAVGQLRMSGAPSRLGELHPAELADIMEQLGSSERQQLLESLPVETAAETLEEVDPELQRAFIAQQEPGKAADILEEMRSTDAADLLRDLHQTEAQSIFSKMERDAAEEIRAILSHEEKSAGGVMSTQCIETRPDQLAGDVLQYVRSIAEEVEVFNQIYVLDGQRHLLGVLSLRELLLAPSDKPLGALMTTDVVSLKPECSLEEVARIFVKYGFRAIPVVDEQNLFLGAIRLMNVLSKLNRFFRE